MENPKYILNKPRARQRIEFHIDYSMDPDGWFYDVQYIENKTNKIAHSHCITQKDVANWIDSLKRQGWILINE
jgi:hypothetical protein